jgi:hypothetical protein
MPYLDALKGDNGDKETCDWLKEKFELILAASEPPSLIQR